MQAKAIARKKKQKKTTVVPCVLAPRYLSRCFLLCICCTLFLLYREFVFSSFAICIAIFWSIADILKDTRARPTIRP